MRLKLIACELLCREFSAALARAPHPVDVEFLSKGLHDLGGRPMLARLQQAVDAVEESLYDAILLGYALCGNGTHGLIARTVPLVIPRAHDCIALLMGSRERYAKYFASNPGVYFRSTGWLERGSGLEQPNYTLDALIGRYGEEDGRFLYDELHHYRGAYRQLTYIRTGLELDERFAEEARCEATRRGWKFELVDSDLRFFEALVRGSWDESEFLVVPPGWRVVARYDDGILDKEPAS